MPNLPSGTVTFRFSDVEGGTELLRTIQQRVLREIERRFDDPKH